MDLQDKLNLDGSIKNPNARFVTKGSNKNGKAREVAMMST